MKKFEDGRWVEMGDREEGSLVRRRRGRPSEGAMRLVYIAGPYTAPSHAERDANVAAARVVARKVALAGASPVCPHMNTGGMEDIGTPEFWYDATMELLAVCDAVILAPGALWSKGARAERDYAAAAGIPVFLHVADLANWLRDPAPALSPMAQCPCCLALLEDDGFGVLAHVGPGGCGYCEHPGDADAKVMS